MTFYGLTGFYGHFSEEFQWGNKKKFLKVTRPKSQKIATLWKIKKYLRHHKHLFVFHRKDLSASLEFCCVSILVRSSVNWAGLMVLFTVMTFNHLSSRKCLVKSWTAGGKRHHPSPVYHLYHRHSRNYMRWLWSMLGTWPCFVCVSNKEQLSLALNTFSPSDFMESRAVL